MKRSSLIIQLFFCFFFCGFGFEVSLNKIKSSLVPKSYALKPKIKNAKSGNIIPIYSNAKPQNNVIKTNTSGVMHAGVKSSKLSNVAPVYNKAIEDKSITTSFGVGSKSNVVLVNKNLESQNINNVKNKNIHLYKYVNTSPIFGTPSNNFYSNLNKPAKHKASYQVKLNNTKAGAHELIKSKDISKIYINHTYFSQKKPLTPLTKLPDIKAYKSNNLQKKFLPKKIVNNSPLNTGRNDIKNNNALALDVSKRKVNILQRFLSIFSTKTKDDISSPVVFVVNDRQKFQPIPKANDKISKLANNTVKDLINDNNYRNLILRYGVFDEMQPDIIHNPKYLKVKYSPHQLSSEAQRIRELSLNQKYLKERLDKRVEEVSKNLLALHSQYPLLSNEQLRNLYNVRSIKDASNVDLALNNLQLLDSIVSHVPILAPSNVKITSHFGPRKLNKSPLRMHAGIDLVSHNRSIYASAAGTVEFTGRDNIYGNFVVIKHANCKTKYGHLEKACVRTGQVVKQGDLIGIEGATGRVTGRHLHLEVLIDQKPVNPIDFLKYSLGTNYKNEIAYKKKCAMEASLSRSQLINISMPNKGVPIKKKQVHLRKPSNKKQKLL